MINYDSNSVCSTGIRHQTLTLATAGRILIMNTRELSECDAQSDAKKPRNEDVRRAVQQTEFLGRGPRPSRCQYSDEILPQCHFAFAP